MNKFSNRNSFSVIFLFLSLFASTAFAAELSLKNTVSEVHLNSDFAVEVSLNSPNEAVNAFEGSINLPSNLKLKEIRFAGSMVPLWIVKPAEKETGTVIFAGLLPGGYQGLINVFTLMLEPVKEGDAGMAFGSDTTVYKNDGEGGSADLTLHDLSFPILAAAGPENNIPPEEDTVPPEPFTPVITEGGPFGYAGKVLIFNTQDKDSGVSRYEIGYSNLPDRNGKNISWQAAESPFFLPPQNFKLFLYVKAIDGKGNERVATVRAGSYTLLFAYSLALSVIIIMAYRVRLLIKKRRHNNE